MPLAHSRHVFMKNVVGHIVFSFFSILTIFYILTNDMKILLRYHVEKTDDNLSFAS
jgi:formate/nitrite transporter FocA (FNT family)